MPLDFGQTKQVYEILKGQGAIPAEWDLRQFSQQANAATGSTEFNAGDVGPIGYGVSSVSNWINQGLEKTGLPQASGNLGASVFETLGGSPEYGREIGEGLPRGIVDFLPMIAAGFASGGTIPALGLIGSSALSAANAFGETGSVSRAATAAALPAVGSYAGKVAGNAVSSVLAKYALPRLGLTGGVDALVNTVDGPVVNRVLQSVPDRIANYLGGQAGGQAAMEGIGYAQDAIEQGTLNPYEGRSFKDWALGTVLGNVPFALADVPRLTRPSVIRSTPQEPAAASATNNVSAATADPALIAEATRELAYAQEVVRANQIQDATKRNEALLLAELNAGKKSPPLSNAGSLWVGDTNTINAFKAADPVTKQATLDTLPLDFSTPEATSRTLGTLNGVLPPKADASFAVEPQDIQTRAEALVDAGVAIEDAIPLAAETVAREVVETAKTQPEPVVVPEAPVAVEGQPVVELPENTQFYFDQTRAAETNKSLLYEVGAVQKAITEAGRNVDARENMPERLAKVYRNWRQEVGQGMPTSEQYKKLKGQLSQTVLRATPDMAGRPIRDAEGRVRKFTQEEATREAERLNGKKPNIPGLKEYSARRVGDSYEVKPIFSSKEAKAAHNDTVQKRTRSKVKKVMPAATTEPLLKSALSDNMRQALASKSDLELARMVALDPDGFVALERLQGLPAEQIRPALEEFIASKPDVFETGVAEETVPVVEDAELLVDEVSDPTGIEDDYTPSWQRGRGEDVEELLGADGRVYRVDPTLELLGKGPVRNVPTDANLYGRLLRKQGFTNDQLAVMAPAYGRLRSLLGLEQVKVGELINDAPGNIAGVASPKAKAIWLAARDAGGLDGAAELAFVQSHEVAHLHEDLFNKGLLPAKDMEAMNDYRNFLASGDARVTEFMTDLKDFLPEKLRNNPQVLEMLKADSPEELYANSLAMWSLSRMSPEDMRILGLASPSAAKGWLKSLTDFSRKVFSSLKSVFGLKERATAFNGKSLSDISSQFERWTKAIRRAEEDMAQLGFMGNYDGQGFANLHTSALERLGANEARGQEGDVLRLATGQAKGTNDTSVVTQAASRWFEGLFAVGKRIPIFNRAASAMADHQGVIAALNTKSRSPLYGTIDAATGELRTKGSVADKERTMVNNDQRASRLADDIMFWNQGDEFISTRVSEGKLQQNNPALYNRLKALPEPMQKAVLNTIDRIHTGNDVTAQQWLGQARESNINLGASILGAAGHWKDGLKLSREMFEAFPQSFSPDPKQALVGQQRAAAVLQQVGPATYARLVDFVAKSEQAMAQQKDYFDQRKGFFSTRRYGDTLLKAVDANGNTLAVIGRKKRDVNAAKARLKKEYPGTVRIEEEDISSGRNFDLDERTEEFLSDTGKLLRERIESFKDVLPDELYQNLLNDANLEQQAYAERAAGRLAAGRGSRKLSPGAENLIPTAETYMGSMNKRAADIALKSRMAYEFSNPELANFKPHVELFKDGLRNYMRPDSDFQKAIGNINMVYYLSANIPAHLTQAVQSFQTAVPELRARGNSTGQSYRLMTGAMKDVAKFTWGRLREKTSTAQEGYALSKWKDAGERSVLLKAAQEGLLGFGAFDDVRHNDLQAAMEMGEGTRKGVMGKLAEQVKKPLSAYANITKKLYASTEHFNQRAALIAGFRAAKQRMGKNFNAQRAYEEAKDFMRTVTYGTGKAGRPVGPYQENIANLGSMAYGLQTYTLGWLGQAARYISHGTGAEYAGLSKAQKADARAAAGLFFGTQVGLAGALGFPFFSLAAAALEKATGEDIRGELYNRLAAVFGEDDKDGGPLADIVMRGAANALLERAGVGVDVGSRFGMESFFAVGEDGFDGTRVLGPSGQIVGSAMAGLANVAKGEWPAAVRGIAPAPWRKAIDYWQNGERAATRSGQAVDLNAGEAIAYQLGFTPTALRKLRQFETYKRLHTANETEENNRIADEIMQAMESAPAQAQMMIASLPREEGRAMATRVADRVIERAFPTDVRTKTNKDPYLQGIAKSIGVQVPVGSERAKMALKQQVFARLGFGYRPQRGTVQQANLLDQLGVGY